jgi:hypothetical protein
MRREHSDYISDDHIAASCAWSSGWPPDLADPPIQSARRPTVLEIGPSTRFALVQVTKVRRVQPTASWTDPPWDGARRRPDPVPPQPGLHSTAVGPAAAPDVAVLPASSRVSGRAWAYVGEPWRGRSFTYLAVLGRHQHVRPRAAITPSAGLRAQDRWTRGSRNAPRLRQIAGHHRRPARLRMARLTCRDV